MRRFLALTGFVLLAAALGLGGWWAWPIVFPATTSSWISTLSKVDAALVQNHPEVARKLLEAVPANLPVSGWLQWGKRVQELADRTGDWTWAAKAASAAHAQYPGNADLAAWLVWTLLQGHQSSEAAVLADKVLKGTPWDSLATQAAIEAAGVAKGDWTALRAALADPGSGAFALYDRLASLSKDPSLRTNALLAALAQGRLDEARTHLDVLTPEQRSQPPFDKLQGLMAYDQGDWSRAAALLKALADNQSDTLLILADVYLHLGDTFQAKIIYDQMLADHPTDFPLALGVNRATLFLDDGDPAAALGLLERVAAAHTGSALDQVRLLTLEARFELGEADAVRAALDGLMKGAETPLALEAELLKGRLFPEWQSAARLWSLLHRHPDFGPLAERLVWELLTSQDYPGAYRALDLFEAAWRKTGQDLPWWSLELRALILGVEGRLDEATAVFDQVPAAWRDATYWADLSLVSLVRSRQVDAESRKSVLEASLAQVNRALDLLPPANGRQALERRSSWLSRRGELQFALVPLQLPAQKATLRSAAAEDFRRAVELDPQNLRAKFLLRQTQAAPQDKTP